MLYSMLFANDPLLEQIAIDANRQRISTTQNKQDPAVRKVQQALLIWDPNCLPRFGADGDYGTETAEAVRRFKVDVLMVQGTVYKDVGPLTVLRLDAIALAHEQNLALSARIAELDEWLTPALSGVFSSVSSSDVIVHTSGSSVFASLKAAIDTCVDSRAIIVIAGWAFEKETLLVLGVTIEESLRQAADRGVQVHAIFNHRPAIEIPLRGTYPLPGAADNNWSVAFINSLPGGAAIHDARALHHLVSSLGISHVLLPDFPIQLGVHHQKAWAVWNGEKLIAWCGGIDIAKNRTELSTSPDAVWHDIQIELQGAVAADVYQILRARWEDNPSRPPNVSLPPLSPNSVTGTHRCRVVTTYGDPSQFVGLGPNSAPYSFAPAGSKATRQMLSHLIRKSQYFIYIEDQYFVDEKIGQELVAHLPNLKALIVLICDSNRINNEMHQAYARRKRVFDHLAPFADKVAVVTRYDRYIHAKTWIFDDSVALVTSANCNRRGYEHDSEIGVVYGHIGNTGTIRDLRENLWSLHLGANAPASGSDPVASLPLWKSPPPGSAITTYNWNAGVDGSPIDPQLILLLSTLNIHPSNDQFWEIIDPHCS